MGLPDTSALNPVRATHAAGTPPMARGPMRARPWLGFRAGLRAARQLYPSRPLTALFQPHLFTRTRDFLPEFAEALQEADTVVLLPIYPARELPLPGITSEALAAAFPEEKRPLVLAPQEAVKWVLQANPSLLMTLGAGDIDRLIPTFERHFAPISQN